MFNSTKKNVPLTSLYDGGLIKSGARGEEAVVKENVDFGFIPREGDYIMVDEEPFVVESVAYSAETNPVVTALVSYCHN